MIVHYLVMEHGEVKSQSKSDWVTSIKRLRTVLSMLVIFEGSIFDVVKISSIGTLSDISVVVSDHLVEEGLGLISASNTHARALDDVDNVDALLIKLLLDLGLVGLK